MKDQVFVLAGLLACVVAAPAAAAAPSEAGQTNCYAGWRQGRPADAGYFPIAVWLQDPKTRRASRRRESISTLRCGAVPPPGSSMRWTRRACGLCAARMRRGLRLKDSPVIVGWNGTSSQF